jgi:signal transduction histidine kinase
VPGLAFTGAVARHRSGALGVHYVDVTPTALGAVMMAGIVGMGVVIVRRYVLAWRAGNPSAGIIAAALAALALIGVNDALVTSSLWHGVYTIDVGFLIPIVAVARDLSARFAAEARERYLLHERLEALVGARTRALQEASQELVSSERMATIARLASGVAHAINNPAAALRTNVHFLLDMMQVGEPVPAEAMATLADTRDLTDRIADFVRRLVDASRVARTEPRYEATAIVRPAALEAGARRAALLPAGAVGVDVAEDLRVAMDPPVLTQVLGMLVQVGSRSGSRGAEIDAEKAGGDLRIRVKAPLSEADGCDDALDRTLAVASGIAAVYGGSVATEADAARERIVLTLRAR